MPNGIPNAALKARGFMRRPRLDQLLEKSLSYPVVAVTAGAGCGKTLAVYNFLRAGAFDTSWVSLSEEDNAPALFWQNFICSVCKGNSDLLLELTDQGMPGNATAFSAFLDTLFKETKKNKRTVIVFDDYHLIHDSSARWFIRMLINRLGQDGPRRPGHSVLLISREETGLDSESMAGSDGLARIGEDELKFTQSETLELFRFLGIAMTPELMAGLPNLYKNTGGWAFLTGLAGRILQKRPDGIRYIKNALKHNVSMMIENELFLENSPELNSFLVKLSLLDHLPADLISTLENGDKLIRAATRCSSLIHYDAFMDEYHIHHFMRAYLEEKQNLLTDEERRGIYVSSAGWYRIHQYKTDAIRYYFKAGDYQSVVEMAKLFPQILPISTATRLFDLLSDTSGGEATQSPELNLLRARLLLSMGQNDRAAEMAKREISRLEGQADTPENRRVLLREHYILGLIGMLTCCDTGSYDFAEEFRKADEYFTGSGYVLTGPARVAALGAYSIEIGRGGAGEPEKYIGAVTESAPYIAHSLNGCMSGRDDLAGAELAYFQSDMPQCRQYTMQALYKAQEKGQYDIENRALFFLVRMGLAAGNYQMIKDAVAKMAAQLDILDFEDRYTRYDVQTGWFYAGIGQKDKVAEWLKNGFSVNYSPTVISNFEDFARCNYYLIEQDYHTMLALVSSRTGQFDVKRYLLGRIALEAYRAVCLLNLDDIKGAMDALRQAYELAIPNRLDMAFTQMGNHMRTLAAAAVKVKGCGVPREWLENIQKKAATYAKRVGQVRSQYVLTEGGEDDIRLTQKELELLRDLSHGLSRNEIAEERGISVNTVKMTIQYIYEKLGAENSMDAVRIAFHKGLL